MQRSQSWLKISMHGTTVLGVAMIALVWGTIAFHLRVIERTTVQAAFQESANLSRAFEEQIARTVRGIDSTLLVLRAIYVKDTKTFDLAEWTWHAGIVTDVVLQYAIIGQDGKLRASSLGRVSPLDLSDRDHFKVHLDAAIDDVFISKPLVGRHSGRASIQLSRRILFPDGTFAGVIVASVDPARLVQFYQSIDIGRDGVINLIGLDGVVRASKGFKREITTTSNVEGGVVARIPADAVGSYATSGSIDGIRRLLSYRKVAGLPLVVAVGLGENVTLESFYADALKYIVAGTAISILVFFVMSLSARHRKDLTKAYLALRRSELITQAHRVELRAALENIAQGLLMVDAQGKITVINRRALELLDLSEEWFTPGRKIKDMLDFLKERGEFADNDFDPSVRAILESGGQVSSIPVYERTRPNGIVLEIRSMPTPEGGLVRTFTDITERKRSEARIAEMATHDELTGLANRSLFRGRVDQALELAQRYDLPFALLMLDLDRFKPINDTLGHPVGDKVLKIIAARLNDCVRESDTVARLGGDEFAILQASAATEDEVRHLAQRILDTVTEPLDVDGQRIEIGTTIGIALAPHDGADHDELIAKADQALYEGKKNGRHCYCFAGASPPLQPSQSPSAPLVVSAR
jgi:diguanylate cyclase (GGDEF)-like protein